MTADIKLPPLPHADAHILLGDDSEDVFIGAALTAYATAAVLADRERVEGVMRMALEALPFVLERRAGVWVTDWSLKGGSGCRPSTEAEVQMWSAITASATPLAPAPLVPLMEEEMLSCVRGCVGGPIPMGLTRDYGPYEVTGLTFYSQSLLKHIQRALAAKNGLTLGEAP